MQTVLAMIDLDSIPEIFEEASMCVQKREWYGHGFRVVRRLPPAGPTEHCGICGLPWWRHERWGCRAAQPMPALSFSAERARAVYRRQLDRRNRLRARSRQCASPTKT